MYVCILVSFSVTIHTVWNFLVCDVWHRNNRPSVTFLVTDQCCCTLLGRLLISHPAHRSKLICLTKLWNAHIQYPSTDIFLKFNFCLCHIQIRYFGNYLAHLPATCAIGLCFACVFPYSRSIKDQLSLKVLDRSSPNFANGSSVKKYNWSDTRFPIAQGTLLCKPTIGPNQPNWPTSLLFANHTGFPKQMGGLQCWCEKTKWRWPIYI